jgi:hypothetical protein
MPLVTLGWMSALAMSAGRFALGRPQLTVVGDPAAAWTCHIRDHVGRLLDDRWPLVKPSDPYVAHDVYTTGLAR